MYQPFPQRILVGLDLSSADYSILSFLEQNARALTEETIQFIHVDEESAPDQPAEQTKAERLQERMTRIKQLLPMAIVPQKVEVLSGDLATDIKEESQARSIDLLVLGQKYTDDPAVAAKQLVKKPGSSLLLVPEQDDYAVNKIGIAIDFSEMSKMAALAAHQLAQKFGATLLGFHTYQVPSGYHKTGKNHLESAEVMEDNARKEAKRFWTELGIDAIDMHYRYDQHQQPAKEIAQLAQENGIDLLIVGSKGRTKAANLVMGSTAKQLTQTLDDVPLMIIKEKNENMGLLDALKEL